ncbi:hypothetical protein TNCV_2750341 [Trichonephila clavipes]|nr:hypothetical protein TNCV_2750341 [Trichonephila clavipes]
MGMVSWAWVEQTNRQVKSQMLCVFQVNTRDLKQNGTMWKDGNEDAKIQEESEEEETVEEEEACGCRDFQLVPREMQGRRKDRLSEYVGFYDSLFEKPEMWEEGVEFQGAWEKMCGAWFSAI